MTNEKGRLILIVDDLRTNRMVMKNALQDENYTFIEASNGQEAVEMAIEHRPQVIIMDGLMPVMDGFEAVKQLRMLEEFKRTPILMISSLTDDKIKLRAIEAGVNDFISKPFEKMELIMRCRAYMEIAHINSKYTLSTKNSYTNMPNLMALHNRLSSSKEETMILMRIDHFRSVEVFYGEEYARSLEKRFIQYLISYFQNLRFFIFCYHTAPGEYAIVFEDFQRDAQEMDIHQMCQMLYEHIKEYEIDFDSFSYDVRATLCYAQGSDDIYKDASFALDYAIEKGMTYVVMNEIIASLKRDTKENIQKIHLVKRAIEEDRIVPYFQPILDNRTHEIAKYETLVRLVKEDGTVLSPFFFLDAAKSGNYYLQMTATLIDKVFSIFRYVESEVTINFSYLDMSSTVVCDTLFALLASYPDTAKRITLEILEDETIQNDTLFYDFIQKVRSYGVKIAIDDFGSGYSNFQRVMEISPDFVKIDGSIIKRIAEDLKSEIFARSINDFSHALGIKTVGEFVSDEAIFRKVQELGIDYTQGYFIAEPSDKLVTLKSDEKLALTR